MLERPLPHARHIGGFAAALMIAATCVSASIACAGANPPRLEDGASIPTYAPCSALSGTETIQGKFDEACVRRVVPWRFVLPDMSGQHYALAAFTLDNPSSPADLIVQYDPVGDFPQMRLEISHDRIAFGAGNRKSILSDGTPLYFDNLSGTTSAYFGLRGDVYSLVVLANGNSASHESLIVALANTMVAQQ